MFDLSGEHKTYQKITPGDTVTGIGSEIYHYVERTIAYTGAGTYVMAVGDTIVGASGGATAIIVARTITGGTDAGGDAAGVLRLRCQVGTFQSEDLNVEGNSNVGTVASDSSIDPGVPVQFAKTALVTVVDNSVMINWDGTTPTNTNGTSADVGHLITAGQNFTLGGLNSIKQFRCLDAVSGINTVVKVTINF